MPSCIVLVSKNHFKDVTICLRFLTYQFLSSNGQDNDESYEQWLLQLGSSALLRSVVMNANNKNDLEEDIWTNWNVLLSDNYGTKNVPDWRPGDWNSICVSMSQSDHCYQDKIKSIANKKRFLESTLFHSHCKSVCYSHIFPVM